MLDRRSWRCSSTIILSVPTRASAIGQSKAFQNAPTVWFCGASDWAVYSATTAAMQLESLGRVLEQDRICRQLRAMHNAA